MRKIINAKNIFITGVLFVLIGLFSFCCYKAYHFITADMRYNNAVNALFAGEYTDAKNFLSEIEESDYKESASVEKLVDCFLYYENNKPSDDYFNHLHTEIENISFIDKEFNKTLNKLADKVKQTELEYKRDLETAQTIDESINALSSLVFQPYDLANEKTTIENVIVQYNNANEQARSLVQNYNGLQTAREKLQKAEELNIYYHNQADSISKKIEKLGVITLVSDNAINSIKQSYNELPDYAKGYVTNIEELNTAERTYQKLHNDALQKAEQEKREQERQAKAAAAAAAKRLEESSSGSSSGTVYWVPNGKVYHSTADCPSLGRSSNIRSGSVSQSGKSRACKNCY